MSNQTKTSKKTGPKAASKSPAKAAPKAVAKAAPKVEKVEKVETAPRAETSPKAAAAPQATAPAPAPEAKVVPIVAVEEAATVAIGRPAATVEVTAPISAAEKLAVKGYDEFTAVQKESIDAFFKAGEVFSRGVEALSKACFDLAQEVAVDNAEAANAMLAVKSFDDLVSLQNDLARKAFDKSFTEGTRISELSIKVANEAFQPIQSQFAVAVEKAFKPIAA